MSDLAKQRIVLPKVHYGSKISVNWYRLSVPILALASWAVIGGIIWAVFHH